MVIEISAVQFGNFVFIMTGVGIGLATYAMRDWYVSLIGIPLTCYSILAFGFLILNDWLVIT